MALKTRFVSYLAHPETKESLIFDIMEVEHSADWKKTRRGLMTHAGRLLDELQTGRINSFSVLTED